MRDTLCQPRLDDETRAAMEAVTKDEIAAAREALSHVLTSSHLFFPGGGGFGAIKISHARDFDFPIDDRDIAFVLAAAKTGATRASRREDALVETAEAVRERLAALVADGGCDLYLIVDRSGSTAVPSIEQGQLALAALLDSAAFGAGARLRVDAFSSTNTSTADIYPIKPFGAPGDFERLRQVGGGGTPTEGALGHLRETAEPGAKHRLAFVLTDGASHESDNVRAQVEAALSEGLIVIGISQHGPGHGHNGPEHEMNRQFGHGWVHFKGEAPEVIIEALDTVAKVTTYGTLAPPAPYNVIAEA